MHSPGLHVGGTPGNTDLALPRLGAGTHNRLWTGNRGKPRGRDPGPLQQRRGRQDEELIDEMFGDDDVCWMDASAIDLDMIIQKFEELKEKINDIINKLQCTRSTAHGTNKSLLYIL